MKGLKLLNKLMTYLDDISTKEQLTHEETMIVDKFREKLRSHKGLTKKEIEQIPFYAFIHNPQVFPFHLVVQETISYKLRGQFWYKHILVKHSLYTCIGQSYSCAKSFKV